MVLHTAQCVHAFTCPLPLLLGHRPVGHYILLCGFDAELRSFLVKDPASNRYLCRAAVVYCTVYYNTVQCYRKALRSSILKYCTLMEFCYGVLSW